MTLFTRTVFLDDTSILSKLDPGTWPERHGDIECRTSHDEIAQASSLVDPDDLEAQLANSVIPEWDRTGTRSQGPVPQDGTFARSLPLASPLFSWLGVPPRRLLPRSQMFPMMGPPILPNRSANHVAIPTGSRDWSIIRIRIPVADAIGPGAFALHFYCYSAGFCDVSRLLA